MTSVLDDYRSAPIDAPFAELLCLIEKAARKASSVTREDVDAVRASRGELGREISRSVVDRRIEAQFVLY